MKKKEEHFKIVILNFFMLFILYAFLLWIMFNMKYNWELTSRQWRRIFYSSLGFNIVWNFVFWHKSKYKVLKLQKNLTEDMEKMGNFLSSNKVRKISSCRNTSVYKVKNKYSLMPMRFSILSEENNYSINAPQFIIDKISKI